MIKETVKGSLIQGKNLHNFFKLMCSRKFKDCSSILCVCERQIDHVCWICDIRIKIYSSQQLRAYLTGLNLNCPNLYFYSVTGQFEIDNLHKCIKRGIISLWTWVSISEFRYIKKNIQNIVLLPIMTKIKHVDGIA